ncbi:MAG: DUF262 domain-containing protein [Myxococcus sp.]|jgi:hypothetical protein|nr:DUF262 domain-containing protein [Myxococcus sp.]
MSFQPAISIAKALERVHKHEYVLPAIQREFVWSTDQICRLFDSLMRGYPFGSFLFWKVEKQNCAKYAFFDFVREYHERDAPHCPPLNLSQESSVVAVLDGQQRLTALNIGLRGSHAEKLLHKRKSNSNAYPKRQLFLDLRGKEGGDDLSLRYQFRFLTKEKAKEESTANGAEHHWFPVSDILNMDRGKGIFTYVRTHGLADNDAAYAALDRLHEVVHQETFINFFEEEDQDLDRVLNIFIRVNSGGTVLSYADLLLSIATAQWKQQDAREAVHRLVDELNETRFGFDFPKDLVLKASLVLTDIPDVAFKVTNFNAQNMAKIEAHWEELASALRHAAALLGDFGFSAKTLTANNVMIPVAYYLMKRGATESYRTSTTDAADREQLRLWVNRSLIKQGIWGSGLDTLLRALREALATNYQNGFPVAHLEAAMALLGKSLRFEEDEVEALLDMEYGKRGTFTVLTLLYPGHDLRNEFHEDHVFPRSLFRQQKLVAAGLSPAEIEDFKASVDLLPNLQILEGTANIQKSAKLPAAWLPEQFPDAVSRNAYVAKHDLGTIPPDLKDFAAFFQARRARIASRLKKLLDVKASSPS